MAILEPRSKTRARLELSALVGSILVFLFVALTPDQTPPLKVPPGATCDRDVFERIIARVRSGDSFYEANQHELRTHGYPTRSVFNWRTPFYAWFLGSFPSVYGGQAVLVALSVAVLVLGATDMLRDHGILGGALGGTLLVGATAWCASNPMQVFTELWAGLAIMFSICAFRRGWTILAVSSGLLALFYRELVFPYVILSLGLAVWYGRKREASAWAVGIGLFVVFMVIHASVVASRLTPEDVSLPGGWIRFGGPRFVLATAQMNIFLMGLPLAWTALILPIAILGLAHSRGETGRRIGLTAGLYLLAFGVVGAPFNYYWGLLDAPLLAFGLARAPSALRELAEDAQLGAGERLAWIGPWRRSSTTS